MIGVEMSEKTQDDVVAELEELLNKLGKTQAKASAAEAELEERRKELMDEFAPRIDKLTNKRERLLAEITEVFQQNRELLLTDDSKTVTLRAGTLSARFAAESLVIDDDAKVEKFLRRLGKWATYSKPVKRKLDKAALKKDRELVESAPPEVMRYQRDENLIIKLPKLQLEIKRVLNPLRSRLAGKS